MASSRKSRKSARRAPVSAEGRTIRASFTDLPGELIGRVAWFLEPDPERPLHEMFYEEFDDDDRYAPIPWLRRCHNLANPLHPDFIMKYGHYRTVNDTKRAYKDLCNLALTCRHIGSHVRPHRVCIVFTGVQLAKLFACFVRHPERRGQVEELHLHQRVLSHSRIEIEYFDSTLAAIRKGTGLYLLRIARDICTLLGYSDSPDFTMPSNIIISSALFHVVPNVHTVFLPWNFVQIDHQMQSLDLAPNAIDASVELPLPMSRKPGRSRAPSPRTLELCKLVPFRLKHLSVRGAHDFPSWGRDQGPNHPNYWATICSNEAFRALQTLTLVSIGEALNRISSDLRLPFLKKLCLYGIHIDEKTLVRMLAATPMLEQLHVDFTPSRRTKDVSINQQNLLDASLPSFPQTLKTLVIRYFRDTTQSDSGGVLEPRERLYHLHTLSNLDTLGIDISSLVSVGDDDKAFFETSFGPLPPKLRHLRVYSNRANSTKPVQQGYYGVQHVFEAGKPIPVHIKLEFDLYLEYLRALCAGLRNGSGSGLELASVTLVMPLFFDDELRKVSSKSDIFGAGSGESHHGMSIQVSLVEKYETAVVAEMDRAGAEITRDCGIRVELERRAGKETHHMRQERHYY